MERNERRIIIPLWPDSAISAPIPVDPLGSYTGRPDDPYEKPVQDVDDL